MITALGTITGLLTAVTGLVWALRRRKARKCAQQAAEQQRQAGSGKT